MVVEKNQIFNLMDTNGRRSDVLNALKVYLEILEELKEESFLLLDEKTGLLNCVKNLCRESGFSPKITYKGVRIDTILDMIANDLGVSILMNHSVDCSRQPGIVKIPLKKTCTSRLIFARNHNSHYRPEEKNFWNYLTQRFIRESNTSLENQN